MRGEQSRLQSAAHGREEEEEEDDEERRPACIRNGKSGRHTTDISEAAGAQRLSLTPAVKVSLMNQQRADKLPGNSWKSKSSVTHPPPAMSCSSNGASGPQSPSTQNEVMLRPSPALQSSPQDSFNSSFSFIQQSLNSSLSTDTAPATPSRDPPEPLIQLTKTQSSHQTKPETFEYNTSRHPAAVQPQGDREELFWRECPWGDRGATSDLPDRDSLDLEITSSLSVDSDTASASSVTSGYESATPASEQGWDSLVKKYEGVLQDCLQNNRTHTKVGMMSRCNNETKMFF